jgi:amino acid transporter
MGGWGIVAADIIVMANLAQIAGQYGFLLVGLDSLADNTFATTAAGVLWIGLMTWICYVGIELSARVQYALLGVETVMLIALSVVALVRVWTGHAAATSISPRGRGSTRSRSPR